MAESPYREAHHVILCPRCGDVFDELFDGVSTCVRCNGLWLAQPTIDRAFNDPLWPHGASAWWRRELYCPVCTSEGKLSLMVPVLDGSVLVDRCRGHGVWFDEGELDRILNAETGLGVLYMRLFGKEMPADVVRKLTGEELAQRRRQASAHKQWLEQMTTAAQEAAVTAQKRRDEWLEACATAKAEVERLEAKLERERDDVFKCERELTAAQMLLQQLESKPPTR